MYLFLPTILVEMHERDLTNLMMPRDDEVHASPVHAVLYRGLIENGVNVPPVDHHENTRLTALLLRSHRTSSLHLECFFRKNAVSEAILGNLCIEPPLFRRLYKLIM